MEGTAHFLGQIFPEGGEGYDSRVTPPGPA